MDVPYTVASWLSGSCASGSLCCAAHVGLRSFFATFSASASGSGPSKVSFVQRDIKHHQNRIGSFFLLVREIVRPNKRERVEQKETARTTLSLRHI